MSFFVIFVLCFQVALGRPNGDIDIVSLPDSTKFIVPASSNNTPEHCTKCLPCSSSLSPIIRDDYVYSMGIGAHKLHTSLANWGQARRICMDEGGNLAVINSRAEALVMKDIHEKTRKIPGTSRDEQVWIGIHDLFLEGDWVTVHGTPLASAGYTHWSTKWAIQPDNAGGKEHCGTLFLEGGLNDCPCNDKHQFFCEIPTPSKCC